MLVNTARGAPCYAIAMTGSPEGAKFILRPALTGRRPCWNTGSSSCLPAVAPREGWTLPLQSPSTCAGAQRRSKGLSSQRSLIPQAHSPLVFAVGILYKVIVHPGSLLAAVPPEISVRAFKNRSAPAVIDPHIFELS
jgi:hypothetical protein